MPLEAYQDSGRLAGRILAPPSPFCRCDSLAGYQQAPFVANLFLRLSLIGANKELIELSNGTKTPAAEIVSGLK